MATNHQIPTVEELWSLLGQLETLKQYQNISDDPAHYSQLLHQVT